MTYLYECAKCKSGEITIIKPMSESSKIEICTECKAELNRIFTSSGIKTADGYKT